MKRREILNMFDPFWSTQYIYCRALKGLVISSQFCLMELMIIQLTSFHVFTIRFHYRRGGKATYHSTSHGRKKVSRLNQGRLVSPPTFHTRLTSSATEIISDISWKLFSSRFPFFFFWEICELKIAMSLWIYIEMNQTKFEFNGIFIGFFSTHSLTTRHDAQSTFSEMIPRDISQMKTLMWNESDQLCGVDLVGMSSEIFN